MATDEEPDHKLMIEQQTSLSLNIDPKNARFPYCIVWTPLPVLSWFIPFIGHIGISREDGVILDFAGPNFVSVDNFAFGAPTRYVPISKEQCYLIPTADGSEGTGTWDAALHKSTQEFQHQAYSLLTCNCHSFVANVLNRLGFQAGGWNLVNLAIFILLNGQWVHKSSIVRTYLPFLIVFGLGVTFGGTTFLTYLAIFVSVLVGWFIVGTYFFKQLIYV
ncbi:hypothetical protein Leryth_008201 [Lithospermum erythrorhizon]|nr:hypothetical protein Leryth_008201 [Lithospermum erythrorhizon]